MNYAEELSKLWKQHLASKPDDAPTVVSLFAGGGGSSLGYSAAGYREKLAVEYDDNAVQVLKVNFEFPVHHGDIRTLDGKDALAMTGLEPGELTVLDGSPPCQGFSTAGKRQVHDPRNSLFRDYVRMITAFQPQAFVMENVPGMVRGKMKWVFVQCLKALKAEGYSVRAWTLDAQWFGVPQARKRLIFIGIRDDLNITPTAPKPTIKTPVGMDQAAGVVHVERDPHGWFDGDVRPGWKPAPTITASGLGSYSYRATVRDALEAAESESGEPLPPVLDDDYGQIHSMVKQGKNANHVVGKGWSNCVKPRLDAPSNTLPKTQGGRGFATVVHPLEPRALTIAEAKAIQSFPPQFKLLGSYQQRWARIGNSVPPMMMRAIADHVHGLLSNKSTKG